MDKHSSLLKKILHNKSVVIGGVILLIFVFLSVFAPLLAPHDPAETNSSMNFSPPTKEYPFGTDDYGRCILSRMLWGGRVTLLYSFLALLLAMAIGIPLGLLAGYYKYLDNVLMRIVDVLMAFPGTLLAIAIVGILGPGLANVTIAVGIGTMPAYARLIRGSVLSLKSLPFVEASLSAGAKDSRIILHHILPNCISTIIVYSMLQMAWVIMSISTLSFLGIGAQSPTPEWGALVSAGRNYIFSSPHVSSFPVIFIFLTVTAFNLVGDGLRDTLDPRM